MDEEMHKGAPAKHFYFSRENRKVPTKAEEILWDALRNRRLHGYKFRRQHPVWNFIADFYCHECRLIVELDGEYHNAIDQKQYDEGRTYELNELKIIVIRFTNREILEDIDFVLGEIGAHLLEYESGDKH
ncbi:MAG: endonuclease domain-containing protein [Cyclobacteriaceae bacterium]